MITNVYVLSSLLAFGSDDSRNPYRVHFEAEPNFSVQLSAHPFDDGVRGYFAYCDGNIMARVYSPDEIEAYQQAFEEWCTRQMHNGKPGKDCPF